MKTFPTTFKNASWLVSDRLIKLGLNFFVGILIARHLGPEDFGLLSYGQALMFLLLPLATFGLPEILVRELSKKKEAIGTDRGEENDRQIILGSAMAIRLVGATMSISVLLAIACFSDQQSDVAKLIIIVYGLSVLPQSFDIIESYFQSANQFQYVSIVRSALSIVFALIRLAAVLFGAEVLWFAALYTLEIVCFAVILIFWARLKHVHLKIGRVNIPTIVELIKHSFPMMLRLFMIAIYMRIDQIFVGNMLGAESLGIYSVATRITEIWYFIPTAIMAAALPNMTRIYETDIKRYEAELIKYMRIMLAISIPAALAISLLSNTIIDLLFDHEYAEAGIILAIQAWAGVFVALGVASGIWIINTNNMHYGLYLATIGAGTSLALNFILLPILGMKGAAIAMLISYAVSTILAAAVFPATRRLFFLQMSTLKFGTKEI